LQRHLEVCLAPLPDEPYILDADATIKPPGRRRRRLQSKDAWPTSSHVDHTYVLAGLRLVLDVDVTAGDHHSSNHAAPALWVLLDRIEPSCWPALLRATPASALTLTGIDPYVPSGIDPLN
jgi:hypothetical protein